MQQKRKTKRVLENPVYKDKVIILKKSDETNGECSMGQLEIAPNGGNGLHTHTAFKETFTAVKGILGVMYKGKRLFLKPGESFTIPLNTPHHFFNDTDEHIVCTVKLEPGHEGFEKGIAIGYGLAGDGKTNKKGIPKSFTHLALLTVLTDTNLTGGMKLLMPLLKWRARVAMRKGMEKELLEKYYYE